MCYVLLLQSAVISLNYPKIWAKLNPYPQMKKSRGYAKKLQEAVPLLPSAMLFLDDGAGVKQILLP